MNPKTISDLYQVYEELIKSTMLSYLDIELLSVDEGTIKLRMPISDKVRQPFKVLHGGATMALAESAASLHAFSQIDDSKFVPVAIEINGSHMQSVSNGAVIAIGRIQEGEWSELIIHNVDIIHEESNTLLSSIRVTSFLKQVRAN